MWVVESEHHLDYPVVDDIGGFGWLVEGQLISYHQRQS